MMDAFGGGGGYSLSGGSATAGGDDKVGGGNSSINFGYLPSLPSLPSLPGMPSFPAMNSAGVGSGNGLLLIGGVIALIAVYMMMRRRG